MIFVYLYRGHFLFWIYLNHKKYRIRRAWFGIFFHSNIWVIFLYWIVYYIHNFSILNYFLEATKHLFSVISLIRQPFSIHRFIFLSLLNFVTLSSKIWNVYNSVRLSLRIPHLVTILKTLRTKFIYNNHVPYIYRQLLLFRDSLKNSNTLRPMNKII